MRKIIQRSFLLLLVLSLIVISGCAKKEVIGEGEHSYNIYFRSNTLNELVSIPYKTDTKNYETSALINELWNVFSSTEIRSAKTTVTSAVVLNRTQLDKKTLNFYFETSYSTMDDVTELLFRASLVRTFAALNGVNNIAIYVGEQPLTDKNGNTVGKMVASNFVGIGSTDINSVQATVLSVYFANKTGDKLICKEMEVAYNSSFSIERFVLETLIEGPDEEGYYATLPSDLKIISVTIKEGICYVNFDSTFVDSALSIQSYIPVYSVVNSLIELPSIRKVQIFINGASDVKFRDTISFAEPFDMNLDYVEQVKK